MRVVARSSAWSTKKLDFACITFLNSILEQSFHKEGFPGNILWRYPCFFRSSAVGLQAARLFLLRGIEPEYRMYRIAQLYGGMGSFGSLVGCAARVQDL